MNKKYFELPIALGMLFFGVQAKSQVKDISVTFSPTAQYTFWDNNAAIEDGLLVGGRVGFGFGQNFEIRGIYEQSLDMKNAFGKFQNDVPDFVGTFQERKVDVKRYGAEFKANLSNKGVAPYLTLGSGIQELKIDTETQKQIYASLGLGVKFKLSNRIVLNLEGKSTVFNLNPGNVLFQEGDASNIDQIFNNFDNTRLYNWSVLAGMQFYLGGRRPEQMSTLDKAYYNKYSKTFSGLRVVFEPVLAYANFNSDSNFKDTYLLGGNLGYNFNKYIGVRAYYLQSTKNEQLSFDWDKLSMYGADVTARLNVATGVVPYLTIGGGYLNQYPSYVGKDPLNTTQNSSYFAKGGLGLSIPITKNVELFGAASVFYTTQQNAENLVSPDELQQHTMFNAGLKIKLGKSKTNTDEALQEIITKNNQDYEARLLELEQELKQAFENNDKEKAIEIINEKELIEAKKKETLETDKKETIVVQNSEETKEKVQLPLENTTSTTIENTEKTIKLTPQELESLIEKAVDEVDLEFYRSNVNNVQTTKTKPLNTTNVIKTDKNVDNKYDDLQNQINDLKKKLEEKSNIKTKKDLKSTEIKTAEKIEVSPIK